MPRTTRGLRSAALLLCALATTMPATAHASGPVNATATFDEASLVLNSRGSVVAIDICAHGDASFLFITGSWTMRVNAARSNGSTFTAAPGNSGVPMFDGCVRVPVQGATTLSIDATLDYSGAGGDVQGHAGQSFYWCKECPPQPHISRLVFAGCQPAWVTSDSFLNLDNILEAVLTATQNQCA
jgi:hypothetical protein